MTSSVANMTPPMMPCLLMTSRVWGIILEKRDRKSVRTRPNGSRSKDRDRNVFIKHEKEQYRPSYISEVLAGLHFDVSRGIGAGTGNWRIALAVGVTLESRIPGTVLCTASCALRITLFVACCVLRVTVSQLTHFTWLNDGAAGGKFGDSGADRHRIDIGLTLVPGAD